MRNFLKFSLLGLVALAASALGASAPTAIPLAPGPGTAIPNFPATYDMLYIDSADGNLKYISAPGATPIIVGASQANNLLSTPSTWTAVQSFTDGDLSLLGSSSGNSILHAPASGGGAVTLMAGTDTVAGLGTAQTFTAAQTLGSGSSLKASALLISPTAPTIASGFGGGTPTIATNGTASMAVTIGTASGSTGVLTLPTAAHGWACSAADVGTPASNLVQQTGSGTTSATFTNYVRTTGVAGTWTSGDVIEISCFAN